MKRRTFLHATAAGSLAAGLPAWALAPDNKYRKQIGIQLYTLRNEIKQDVDATLKAVVEAGYVQGEMYGFPDCQPMIEAARKHGLELHSSHFAWESVTEPDKKGVTPFAEILEKAVDIGLTHLVIPYLHARNRKNLDDYRRLAERCNKAAVAAKKAGIQLAYHNHAFEFEPKEGGVSGYDILVKEFAPEMQFEVDVFWVVVGNVEPVELIRKLKGRVSQLHLKDLVEGQELPSYGGVPKEAFKELGNGMIPMKPIIEAAAEAGVMHCHVEQDHSPHPVESIRQSMTYLKDL